MKQNTEMILPSTKVKIDYKQKQKLRSKKNRGQEKPYEECQECLYISGNCVLCKNGNEFFDRGNLIYDTVVETFIEDGVVSPLLGGSVSGNNRVATQIRDGCNS
jgi:hypothetical protein